MQLMYRKSKPKKLSLLIARLFKYKISKVTVSKSYNLIAQHVY